MKRVFYFKKGETTDWDESIIHFLENKLTPDFPFNCDIYTFNNDYKVTIIVEANKRQK
jgi:hypothetical protein